MINFVLNQDLMLNTLKAHQSYTAEVNNSDLMILVTSNTEFGQKEDKHKYLKGILQSYHGTS